MSGSRGGRVHYRCSFCGKGQEEVRRLILEHPRIGLAALKLLAWRLRSCSDLVETLSLREVGQRLARLLLAEGRSAGGREGRGLAFELKLTNHQIAARVGTVREVVSRSFARMPQDGLVAIEGRRVLIPDEGRLAEYAEE